MAETIVCCTDGSDLAVRALAAGLAVVRPGAGDRVIVATVIEPVDPSLVTGAGLAGGVMTPEGLDQMAEANRAEGQLHVDDTVAALGLPDADTEVLIGAAGPSLCELATTVSAHALVIGSRGSQLALWQANYIKDRLEGRGITCAIEIIHTRGDKILDVPLAKLAGKDCSPKRSKTPFSKAASILPFTALKISLPNSPRASS
jgi:hypothetical protein